MFREKMLGGRGGRRAVCQQALLAVEGGGEKRETTTSPTPVPPGELTRTLGGGKRLILRLPTSQNTKVYPVKASHSAQVSLGSFSNDDGSENVKKE